MEALDENKAPEPADIDARVDALVMPVLNKCPCGEVPTGLHITDNGQGGKWATVSGNCCDNWMVEFRTEYRSLDSDGCMVLAAIAWNNSPREQMKAADDMLSVLLELQESASYWSEYDVPIGIVDRINSVIGKAMVQEGERIE